MIIFLWQLLKTKYRYRKVKTIVLNPRYKTASDVLAIQYGVCSNQRLTSRYLFVERYKTIWRDTSTRAYLAVDSICL